MQIRVKKHASQRTPCVWGSTARVGPKHSQRWVKSNLTHLFAAHNPAPNSASHQIRQAIGIEEGHCGVPNMVQHGKTPDGSQVVLELSCPDPRPGDKWAHFRLMKGTGRACGPPSRHLSGVLLQHVPPNTAFGPVKQRDVFWMSRSHRI